MKLKISNSKKWENPQICVNYILQQPLGQGENQKEFKKASQDKQSIPKLMKYYKSNIKREVYSNKCPH